MKKKKKKKKKNNSMLVYMARKSVRKTIRKRNKVNKGKRRTQKIKTHKKYGGSVSEFKRILLSLMSEKYIPFLPTTLAVKDMDQTKNYLRCVSAFDLLSIIGKNKKYANSKSITSIVKDVDTQSRDIYNALGELVKIPVSNKVMSNFMINCKFLSKNQLLKDLREFILECEDSLSIKYVDWYKVALGLIKLDDEFESIIREEIKERKIYLDTSVIKYGLEILQKDNSVKNMFKQRIIECGHKPQGFFDSLFGSISWDSYNECFKCSDNKCVVYLDDNYKSFLYKKHNIKSIDKIKILIYVELRLRALSKYFSLEGMRMVKQNRSKVKSLLNKIYRDDMNHGRTNENELKQYVMKPVMSGGADEVIENATAPNPLPEPTPAPDPLPDPLPGPAPDPSESLTTQSPAVVTPDATPLPEPAPAPLPEPALEPLPEPAPLPDPAPAPLPEPAPAPLPEPVVLTGPEPAVVTGSDPVVTPMSDPGQGVVEPVVDPTVTLDPIVALEQQLDTQQIDTQVTDNELPASSQLTQTPPETSNVSVNDKEIDISNIIYVTYVDTKYNDKQGLGQIETNIMNTLVNNFVRLTGAVNKSSFNVYNIRFGPSTTSTSLAISINSAVVCVTPTNSR